MQLEFKIESTLKNGLGSAAGETASAARSKRRVGLKLVASAPSRATHQYGRHMCRKRHLGHSLQNAQLSMATRTVSLETGNFTMVRWGGPAAILKAIWRSTPAVGPKPIVLYPQLGG